MRSWQKCVLTLMTISAFHTAQAQDKESAPQEPPFVQEENEFDSLPSAAQSPDEADALSIEEEIKNAQPNSEKKKETVNLNEQQPADNSQKAEEELQFEDTTQPVVEEPIAPVPEPVVEVKPPPRIKQSPLVQRSAKGGVEYIEHPLAAKGLTAITKEGAYIYKTRTTESENKSGAFRLGMMDSPKISGADGITFANMYGDGQQPMFMYDYEWQPFTGYGKLGVQLGIGVLMASGHGRFVAGPNQGKEAREKYTFVAFPINLGVMYRLEWMSRQWFAPYVAGGGTYIPVAEFRDDDKGPNAVGTPGAYGAAGILLNISALDRETAFTLNSEYGISNLWVSLDYRYLQTFNDDLDFTSSIIGAGIVVDY